MRLGTIPIKVENLSKQHYFVMDYKQNYYNFQTHTHD